MKKYFEIIKNYNAAMIVQDDDAGKLLASRARLLALNAIFDAALAGESARHIAKGINSASDHGAEGFVQNMLSEESTTEH